MPGEPGGWGVLLVAGDAEQELCGGAAETTNKRMELTAAIRALGAMKRRCHISIYTHSKYVLQGVTEWLEQWKLRGWKTAAKKPVKNEDLWRELDDLLAGHDIEWHWVKGRSGRPGNERADALANQGVDRMAAAG